MISTKAVRMSKVQARRAAKQHIQAVGAMSVPSDINYYLSALGIEPPKAETIDSYFLRLACPDWWARKLVTKSLREAERISILSGSVSKGRQIYCSDDSLEQIQTRQRSTLDYLKGFLMVSDCGDEIEMLDILEKSLANPTNRRAELMVRMAGFEHYADDQGHVGVFYTLTTPSKYHRYSGKSLNDNYDAELTPRAGQRYLVKLWAQIRAQFKRDNINPYGFRVAEPHHDGTPHWHLLLFMPPQSVPVCTAIMQDYATREDGDEPGAAEHRFTVKMIDRAQGSATGYIAKYISKNIGFDIDSDNFDDSTLSETGQRVRTWASIWGIRQFQQIGGASVTVWRELRRLKDSDIHHDIIKQARDFAVSNDWAGFLAVMGGVEVKRVEREIQLLKSTPFDVETGDITLNRYNEIVTKIIGIAAHAAEYVTHVKVWRTVKKFNDVRRSDMGGSADRVRAADAWSSINNCTQVEATCSY